MHTCSRAGEWVEAYCRWCHERECKSSTVANYVSGLINTLQYVLVTSEVEEHSPGLSSSLEQLLNLRQQLESQARVDALYARRHPAFIPWSDVQRTRLAARRVWESVPASASRAEKRRALLEYLLVLFFSVAPPDRCGVVRCACRHVRGEAEGFLKM